MVRASVIAALALLAGCHRPPPVELDTRPTEAAIRAPATYVIVGYELAGGSRLEVPTLEAINAINRDGDFLTWGGVRLDHLDEVAFFEDRLIPNPAAMLVLGVDHCTSEQHCEVAERTVWLDGVRMRTVLYIPHDVPPEHAPDVIEGALRRVIAPGGAP